MLIKHSELIWELFRCLFTAVVIYLLLLASGAAAAVVGEWMGSGDYAASWLLVYATFIAPLTAVAVTIWLWLLENHYG